MKSGYRILRKIFPSRDEKLAANCWINSQRTPMYIVLRGIVRMIYQTDKDRENHVFKSKFIN